MFLGRVASLGPFEALRRAGDVCLWMRWVEPDDLGLDCARIELAAETRNDERTARIVARSRMRRSELLRELYHRVEPQGAADLYLFEEASANAPPLRNVYWFAKLDLTRALEAADLPAEGTPARYL